MPGPSTPGHFSERGAKLFERGLDLFLCRFVDVQHQRFSVIRNGAVILTDKSERIAATFESRPIVRGQPDGLIVIDDCTVVLSPAHMGISTIIECCGVIWLKPNHLVI